RGRSFFPLSLFLRGNGWGERCFSKNGESFGESPSPGLLRHPTSPRIRLRQKARFGGQEHGEVKTDASPAYSAAIDIALSASDIRCRWPQSRIAAITGTKLLPLRVRRYSTFGGTTP